MALREEWGVMYTIRGGIRVMLLEQQFGFFVELGAGWEVNT